MYYVQYDNDGSITGEIGCIINCINTLEDAPDYPYQLVFDNPVKIDRMIVDVNSLKIIAR